MLEYISIIVKKTCLLLFSGHEHKQAWRKIFYRTPILILKQTAVGVCKTSKCFNLDTFAPLHIAVLSGNFELFQYLFDNSNEQNPSDNLGTTPFHCAAYKGHLEICRKYLENKIDKNLTNNLGWTALHKAASEGHFKVCRLLLESQVDKNLRTNIG